MTTRACYDWHLWWNQTNMRGRATSDGSVLDTPQVIVPEALRRCPRVPGVWGWCMLVLGKGERSAGAQGGANICAGLHTHWLYCQPYTKKQLPGLTCVQTIIFPLLLLGVNYLCQTTLIGIVVLKSYNYKCNPDQSNALCTIIRHYIHYMVITITIILLILSPIAKQSGVLNIKQLFLILLHHPPSSSIILLLILLLIVMQSGLYNTHSVYQAATQAGRDQWTSYQTTSTPTHFDKRSPSRHHHHLHRPHHQ